MTGIINANKSAGVSSAREVAIVKRLTGMPCGHMGTLDPMACGVLPIAVGNAAKAVRLFFKQAQALYRRVCVRHRYRHSRYDGHSDLVGRKDPLGEEIEKALPLLTGEYDQIPPQYSAKSVGGERGYKLARRGEKFELPPKRVSVGEFRLLALPAAGLSASKWRAAAAHTSVRLRATSAN